jgi:hypothetical protein
MEEQPMRALLILAALPLLGAAPPTAVQPAASLRTFAPYAARVDCPDTPMSLARKDGAQPELRRLGELPPAQAFAAVDRRIAGCPAPMLMSEARR